MKSGTYQSHKYKIDTCHISADEYKLIMTKHLDNTHHCLKKGYWTEIDKRSQVDIKKKKHGFAMKIYNIHYSEY